MSTLPVAAVPNPRPIAMPIVTAAFTPTNIFQGWLRQLWNMINATLNKGYTGTITISGETLTFQNGVLIGKSP